MVQDNGEGFNPNVEDMLQGFAGISTIPIHGGEPRQLLSLAVAHELGGFGAVGRPWTFRHMDVRAFDFPRVMEPMLAICGGRGRGGERKLQ